MGGLAGTLVLWITARRWAVALLIGLLCVGGGRFLRTNAHQWSRDVVTVSPDGTTTTTSHFDQARFDSLREDGLCLIAFGLMVCVVTIGAWVLREPATTPKPPLPDPVAELAGRSEYDS